MNSTDTETARLHPARARPIRAKYASATPNYGRRSLPFSYRKIK